MLITSTVNHQCGKSVCQKSAHLASSIVCNSSTVLAFCKYSFQLHNHKFHNSWIHCMPCNTDIFFQKYIYHTKFFCLILIFLEFASGQGVPSVFLCVLFCYSLLNKYLFINFVNSFINFFVLTDLNGLVT